jgi:hypothetical protein
MRRGHCNDRCCRARFQTSGPPRHPPGGAREHAVLQMSSLSLCHGSSGQAPSVRCRHPGVLAPVPMPQCLWAPTLGAWKTKAFCLSVSGRATSLGQESRMASRRPRAGALKDTPARLLHRQRHGGVSDNGGPFHPGPAQATILHSAGPSRPARQQTPTDGQWAGSGCATCFHPGAALLSAAPCSSGSLIEPKRCGL